MQDVTVVVPLYNEEDRWQADYWRPMVAIPGTTWLFVDDGSSDRTPELVARFAEQTGVGTLSLGSNVGKANAVRAGLIQAMDDGTPGVGFLDGDGAFDVHDVTRIVADFRNRCLTDDSSEFESVWSSRVALAGHHINRRASRHYLGRIIATLISPGIPDVPYDTQCGFKLFRSSGELTACLANPFSTRWFFDVELLQRWITLTGKPMRIWEVPLLSWHDVAGSKLSGRASIQVGSEIVRIMRTNRHLR